jgi:HPt (histidine-containing phosphotransfer) domain-containing protein
MPYPGSTGRVIVRLDRDFEDIVPNFLANRRKDLHTLRHALHNADFSTIQMLGHRMKGDGGGYGFDRISELGTAMEHAALRHDHAAAETYIAELEDFLARLQIEYR